MRLAIYSTIYFCPGILPHHRCLTEMHNNGTNLPWTKVSIAMDHISLYKWLILRNFMVMGGWPWHSSHWLLLYTFTSFNKRFPSPGFQDCTCHTKARVVFIKVFTSFFQGFSFIFDIFLPWEIIESKIYFFSVSFRFLKTGLMTYFTQVFYKKISPATWIFLSTRLFSNFITCMWSLWHHVFN